MTADAPGAPRARLDAPDGTETEVNELLDALGAWIRDHPTVDDVSMPFALARMLCEVVRHDDGTVHDCAVLVASAWETQDGTAEDDKR